jgi:hypothetical protein
MLKKKGVYTVEDLPSLVPSDAARYHLFRKGNMTIKKRRKDSILTQQMILFVVFLFIFSL